MKRVICMAVLGAAIVTSGWAQVYPVVWDSSRPQPAPAPVPKTGQTTSYTAGDDGDLTKGVPWPTPRFTDNGDGTVADDLTGLVWLRDASCNRLVGTDGKGRGSWATAVSAASLLAHGTCGLTDGSVAGDWRLANIKELESLTDFGNIGPALPDGHPFTGVVVNIYWSSTPLASSTEQAWGMGMQHGFNVWDSKARKYYVWPVRGGR